MKKTVLVLLSVVLILALTGCGSKPAPELVIDFGSSSLFTVEELNSAVELIQDEFNTWEGCELHSISYAGDQECSEANIAWMNDLAAADGETEAFTQCIMLTSSFHSPKNGAGAWEKDHEYTDWQWWLARSEGGEWKLMTWGY